MQLPATVTEKPDQFDASGASPPLRPVLPPELAAELAHLLAQALLEDIRRHPLGTLPEDYASAPPTGRAQSANTAVRATSSRTEAV